MQMIRQWLQIFNMALGFYPSLLHDHHHHQFICMTSLVWAWNIEKVILAVLEVSF